MGLDTDIYRVNREKAEANCSYDEYGNKCIEYWSITDDVKSVCYQRKHYPFHFLLVELTSGNQCQYYELTKLKAYHLLYAMQVKHKWQDSSDRKRCDQFVQEFKQVLHNFDWDRDMMVWSWC